MAHNHMIGERGSQAHGTRAKQNPDDGRPSTSSKHSRREKDPECIKKPGRSHKIWNATKSFFSCSSSSAVNVVEPFIPEPSSPAPDHSGVKPNNEKAPERMKKPGRSPKFWEAKKAVFSSSSSSDVNVVEPFIPPADPVPEPSSPAPDHSGVKSNNGQQVLSRANSLEGFLCPPLPGQVPVEPTETSTGRTAQGAVEASPVNKSSTDHSRSTAGQEVWRPCSDDRDQDPLPRDEQSQAHGTRAKQNPDDGRPSTSSKHSRREKAPECMKKPGRSHKIWNATKSFFSCSSSSAVNVVEPFIPEPSSPAPDHSGVKPNNGQQVLSRANSLEGFLCPPLPGQVPVEPTETSTGRTAQGAVEASPVNKSSTGRSRSWSTTSTDSSPGITSSSACSLPEAHVKRRCRESCNLCSRSGDGSESPNQQDFSRFDKGFLFPFGPPLLDQVPVEPTETSTGRTAQGAVEASPVNISSTESFKSLYNVEKLLGSGSYGTVCLGTRKFDGKEVAIKRISKFYNNRYLNIPGYPQPLVTEVALLLLIKREPISPFVIQMHEWFEHPRSFTLVMEYPENCMTLRECITNKCFYEWFSRVVMIQAVRAVQHCIHCGVFHSDIHAENILISQYTLKLKLIDFGCGQLYNSEGYRSVKYRGAMQYSPPEVFTEPRFHAIPANVWSLGVLLYELSNACLPFKNVTEIIEAEVTFLNPKLLSCE